MYRVDKGRRWIYKVWETGIKSLSVGFMQPHGVYDSLTYLPSQAGYLISEPRRMLMSGEHAGYNTYGKHVGDKTHVNRKKYHSLKPRIRMLFSRNPPTKHNLTISRYLQASNTLQMRARRSFNVSQTPSKCPRNQPGERILMAVYWKWEA
ncbi:hypothetical protein IQ07DRAFT_276485 [Pyrenochaeta sp. DS3sAY3a]|nr:hypothetical protein IQ07DRAFT_276485 [Pyrenochaeta sp. DS3sAY3a]